MSLMYIKNSGGPSTVPCGTPDDTGTHCDDSPPTTTRCWRFARKLATQVCNLPRIPYDDKQAMIIFIFLHVIYDLRTKNVLTKINQILLYVVYVFVKQNIECFDNFCVCVVLRGATFAWIPAIKTVDSLSLFQKGLKHFYLDSYIVASCSLLRAHE